MDAEPRCTECGERLEAAFQFCPYCGHKAVTPTSCPSCGAARTPGARFCPNCGTDLEPRPAADAAQADAVTTQAAPVPVTASGVTIEFPFSSAQTFDFAVAEARKFPTFVVAGEGKKALYRVTFAVADLSQALPLVDLMKGWRGRTVYLDGTKLPWDDVFAFRQCFEHRQGSYRPEAYCFGEEQEWSRNLWGCIQSQLPWSEHAEWFCHGRFVDKKGTWEFDKARLRHELERNLYRFRLCPAMDTGLVEQLIVAFPERVNPLSDKNWKFVEDWSGTNPNTLIMVRKTSWGDKEEVRMKGVAPIGLSAAKQIASKLRRQLPMG